MPKVDSRAIDFVSYSQKDGTLKIRMRDRSRIAYYNVPPGVYKELLEALSPGEYFNHSIRDHYNWNYIN